MVWLVVSGLVVVLFLCVLVLLSRKTKDSIDTSRTPESIVRARELQEKETLSVPVVEFTTQMVRIIYAMLPVAASELARRLDSKEITWVVYKDERRLGWRLLGYSGGYSVFITADGKLVEGIENVIDYTRVSVSGIERDALQLTYIVDALMKLLPEVERAGYQASLDNLSSTWQPAVHHSNWDKRVVTRDGS